MVCNFIRDIGEPALKLMGNISHPKSRVGEWDKEVYASIVERSNDWFHWNDIHWKVPKRILLHHTNEWNVALEQYCNDVGLKGAEREEVIRKHTANPLAPCASLTCDKFETVVKEFKQCSNCFTVAYCSVDCQKQDRKRHKKQFMQYLSSRTARGRMG